MDDSKLRALQLCELEILNEFVRVCERHNLRYFLVGGTLLGAVRHQGFIPWDDDIDVGMLREDYEKFSKIAQVELSEQYFYQSPQTDPHYFLTYNKIRKHGTQVYEERFRNSNFHKGVFIDIFPLDFCPKPSVFCHFLFNVLAVMNYRGQVDSGEDYQPYDEWMGKIGYGVLRLFSPKLLVNVRKAVLWLSKICSGKNYVASYSGAYGYEREVQEVDAYVNVANLSFCNESYSVSSQYLNYLTLIYGENYMDIPEISGRKSHDLANEYLKIN